MKHILILLPSLVFENTIKRCMDPNASLAHVFPDYHPGVVSFLNIDNAIALM